MTNVITVAGHIKENRGKYIFLSFILLFVSYLEFWRMPGWSGNVITGLLSRDQNLLILSLEKMLFAGILLALSGVIERCGSVEIKKRTTISTEKIIIQKYYRMQSLTDLDNLSVLRQTLPQACEREANGVRLFIKNVSGIIFASVFIAITNWRFLIFTYGAALFLMLLSWMRQKKIKGLAAEYEGKYNSLYQRVWEQVYNREVTPFLNMEKVISGYRNENSIFLKSLLSLKKAGNMPQSMSMLGSSVLMSISLAYGGYLFFHGKMEMQEIYIMAIVVPMLANVILQIPNHIVDYHILLGAYDILNQFLSGEEYIETGKAAMNQAIKEIEVEVEEMGYSDEEPVLKNISLKMRSKEFVVLVGESGSGKSTFIKNLAALDSGYRGVISVNGEDLRNILRKSYWKQVDYLGQKPSVTKGTVKRNIVLNKSWEEEKYWEAVDAAGLDREVSLKNTMDSLSSGELQKVCFARIFYQDKSVWLLDEATSALDLASEEKILKVLQRKCEEGKLIFAVAHRCRFVEAAQRILYVGHGTLKEADSAEMV